MKTLSAVKYAVGASVVALALTACTKNEEPNNAQEADIVVAEPVIQEIQAVCDEPSLRNRLVDSLQVGLLDSALLEVQGYDDATRLGLEQQVRQKLTGVDINLQNVTASGATCRADVHFTLPAQDIAYANSTFENNGLTALDEQAAEAGAALVGGNRLIAKDFAYTIEDNKAVIGTDNAVLSLVAKTLVAAVHGMAGESHANAQNAPAVRLEPVQPIAAPRIQKREEAAPTAQPTQTVRQEQPQQRPAQTEPRTQSRPESLPRAQAEAPKKETPRPQRTQEQARPKAEPAAPSQTARPQKQTESAPAVAPAPAPAPVQQSAADENVELTIVESNDTY